MSYQRDKHRGRASFGLARGSAHTRNRATRAVRTLTALGVTTAVVGTGYLTAALVPAAHGTTATGTTPVPTTTPSATAAARAKAKAAVPHSLTATKKPKHHANTPAKAAVTKARVTHTAVTHAAVTHAPVTHAPVTQAPVTQAPATHAPVTHAPPPPPPKPVVTSGGS